ncbi:MAG: PIN domain-containing protein [Bacteroidetes bacterium]|nr:PIN domain-containing protein [Bacteroidota bacterium]MBK8873536.1 PIN domain-containing protein [Bacteroidota bacterium]
MAKVFVDTDIILDLLAGREPYYQYAAKLFSLADSGKIEICVSSLTFSNLNYILSKQFSVAQARKKLLTFKTLVTVLSVNEKVVDLALNSDFKDFEDALQYFTATEFKVTTLLTRNLKDFKKAEIAVLSAEQYLKQG